VKEAVAFLKKSSAKNFRYIYTGCFNVPREQKFFAELSFKKATAYFSYGKASMRFFLLSALICITLAACGRRGAPLPPGPAADIIYPHPYPAQ